MSDTLPPPPGSDDRSAEPPFRPPAALPINADAAAGIPIARPVFADLQGPPPPQDPAVTARQLSPWRAAGQLILLLFLGVVVVIVGIALVHGMRLDQRWKELVLTISSASVCMLAAFTMARSHGGAASIGWRVNNVGIDVAIGLSTGAALLVCIMAASIVATLLYPDMLKESEKTREAIQQTLPPMSLPVMTVVLAFVAVWEEVIFRGFLLTRLQAILRRWWLTIPIGALLFTLGHGYQGPLAMGVVWLLGVVMGGLFVWRRSLLPGIVLHFAFNFTMLLLLRAASPEWH